MFIEKTVIKMSVSTSKPTQEWEKTLHASGEDEEILMRTHNDVFRPLVGLIRERRETILDIKMIRYAGGVGENQLRQVVVRWNPADGLWNCVVANLNSNDATENSLGKPGVDFRALTALCKYLDNHGLDQFIPLWRDGSELVGREFSPQFMPLIIEEALRAFVKEKLGEFKEIDSALGVSEEVISSEVKFPRHAAAPVKVGD